MEQRYSWNADSRAPTKDIPVVFAETVFTRVALAALLHPHRNVYLRHVVILSDDLRQDQANCLLNISFETK
jgi:hypothetical protein